MKNKSLIIGLFVLVAVLCLYYLSFTIISRNVQNEATRFSTDKKGNVDFKKRQKYLDSLWNEPVYNFLGLRFTYKEVKDKEIALGLDLQGGIHVVLEVSPIEIIKALSGNNKNADFQKALKDAQKMQANSQANFVDLFYKAYQNTGSKEKLSKIFTTTANQNKVDYKSTDEKVLKMIKDELSASVDRSFNILRTRVDKFGVTNPTIQKLPNTGRILIELPGADNPERVRKLLSGMAVLEFWEVWELQQLTPYLQQFNEYLVKTEQKEKTSKTQLTTDGSKTDTTQKSKNSLTIDVKDEKKESKSDLLVKKDEKDKKDTLKDKKEGKNPLTVDKDKKKEDTSTATANAKDTAKDKKDTTAKTQRSSFIGSVMIPSQEGFSVNPKDTARVNEILRRDEVKAIFPANLRFLWGVKPEENGLLTLYSIKTNRSNKAPLGGEVITDAYQDYDQSSRPEVNMRMNLDGAKKWRKLTADNIGNRIAIVLDDYVYSCPSVRNEIPSGSSSISGSFTIEEAKDLANILKAGKLPAPTRIVEEAIVGPSLGRESINQGFMSMLVGMGAVILFMILYYNNSGSVADIALFANIFFIIGFLAQFGLVLTLPGMAGIVLTIGMSVDANVLIFERIKEELRTGKNITAAVKAGYEKAFSSILDSNATTFLTGAILYSVGTGGVKGFAVTLMIGILCSLATAIFISRLIIEWWIKNPKRSISFDTIISKNVFQNPHINFIGNRRIAYLFSGSLIVAGLVLTVLQGGMNLGVDFNGGRSYVVSFNQAVTASDARSSLSKEIKGSLEVKTYGSNNQLKITSNYLIEDESNEADVKVEAALLKGLEKYNSLNPTILSSSKVGATIADDIKNTSQLAIFLSLIMMFVYILVRFRNWQYGLGAVVALFHDVLMVIAFYAFARAVGISFEVDQVFIAAILTVVGYSINDTVVVFDRIREFAGTVDRKDFNHLMNSAINETLSRTIMTAFTTLVVVICLLLLGGEVLRGFSYALLVGIVMGTYSSIFIASPVVLDFAGFTSSKKAKATA